MGKSLGSGGSSFGMQMFNAPGFAQRDWLAFYQGYPYAATQVISQRLARIELIINENQSDASGDNIVELDDHPFYDLLDDPLADKSMSRFEMLEQVAVYFLLCGEVFAYTPAGKQTNEPKQIILLRPDLVTPAIDKKTGAITGYTYNLSRPVPFDIEEMWVMKRFNPKNPYRGYGLVEAALPYIQTENYASRFASNFFFNSAKPAGIVSVSGTMDKDEFMQLREQWKQDFKGVQNAGKVGFVRNAEVDFTQIGPSTEQSGVIDIKEISKGDILNIWRTPKTLLGEAEDVNRASAETAQYVFAVNNLDPEMYRLVDGLRSLFNRFVPEGLTQTLDYKSPVPEDNTEKIDTWRAMFQMGALTPNDIRDDSGMEDLEGGDQAYLPVNLGPIGGVVEPPPEVEKRYKIVKGDGKGKPVTKKKS